MDLVHAEAGSRAGGATESHLDLSTTVEPAAEIPSETALLVSDSSAEVAEVAETAETAETAESTKQAFVKCCTKVLGPIEYIALLLIPALVGIAPFMWPMEGEPAQCFIPERNYSVLNVTCATLEEPVFVWYTCPVWLLTCSGMLLEFFNIQFQTVGFGHRHSIFILLLVMLTYVLLEVLVVCELREADFPAPVWQSVRVFSIACCAWPFIAVSIWLVHRHGVRADEYQATRTSEPQAVADTEPEPEPGPQPEPQLEPHLEPHSEPQSQPKPHSEPERKTCWGHVCNRQKPEDIFRTSSFRSTGFWSEQRDDIPKTLLEYAKRNTKASTDKATLPLHKIVKLQKSSSIQKLDEWRDRANLGATARIANVRSTVWFWGGFMLLIVNWAWLQLFVLLYMEYATSPAKISIGVLIFNQSETILGGVVGYFMKNAESERKRRKRAILLKRIPCLSRICCSLLILGCCVARSRDKEGSLRSLPSDAVDKLCIFLLLRSI